MLGAPAPGFALGPADQAHGACVAMRDGQALFIAEGAGSPRVDEIIRPRGIGARRSTSADRPRAAGRACAPLGAGDHRAAPPARPPARPRGRRGRRRPRARRRCGGAWSARPRRADRPAQPPRPQRPPRRSWAAVARAGRRPCRSAILDLDRFKAYNDTHGHQARRPPAARRRGLAGGQLRQTDLLARWGGEESGCCCPAATSASGRSADRAAARKGQLARRWVTFSGRRRGLGPAGPGVGVTTLVAAADAAL